MEKSPWKPFLWLLASSNGLKSIWKMILLIRLGCSLASPGKKVPINPFSDLQLGFPRKLSCSKNAHSHHWMSQIGQQEEGTAPTHPCPRGNANDPSIPPTSLGPKDKGRICSLVNAGLGVGDLVEAGDLKPEGVAPLALVHVVPKGQDHLQELLEAAALQHCLGAGTDG